MLNTSSLVTTSVQIFSYYLLNNLTTLRSTKFFVTFCYKEFIGLVIIIFLREKETKNFLKFYQLNLNGSNKT
ncbi:unnamed protein product [Rhizophagus irregularis]|uniref:Uncharacterized protein n=1 Tax=Rhizophagus irregularis TaxID=588596 RepID=A0A915YX21_9GLOM|nr:unnamed protein product [Rhizophagus irregularis]CAB5351570.1 unnamed protein product [Rhizophagus irregularis]